MKKMIRLSKMCAAAAIFLATVLLVAGVTMANAEPPLKARVTFEKASFNLDDPGEQIKVYVTLENQTGDVVWTQEGFSETGYHFYLYFKGPGVDGPLITFTSKTSTSPTPGVEPPLVNVEKLESGWLITMPIEEVREYYPLTQPGQYKVWFSMPFVQYDTDQVQQAVGDNDVPIPDKFVAPSGATVWTDPIEFKETYITLTTDTVAVKSDVKIMATEYIFGEGNHPGVTKKPLTNIDVRLYKISAIEAMGITPVNPQVYGSIATNDTIPCKLAQTTNTPGEYIFRAVSQDPGGYLVLGHADRVTDYKHLGRLVEADDPNWGVGEISRKLILMTDNRGKKSPGKSKKITGGSELLIIEPEYVEWTSNEEFYPLAFESVGDWGVEVSVAPPEGYVADQSSLSESVTSELEGIQFTITDIGSKRDPTYVKYKITHNHKIKEMCDEIGLKLTRKQAMEENTGMWALSPEIAREEVQELTQKSQEENQECKQAFQEIKQESPKDKNK